jgi:hypothetical protein
MRRTLKLLGLVGVVTAAGAAATRRVMAARPGPSPVQGLPSVTSELRHALDRFEERFGA